jgi:hypothetical protein
MVSEVQFLLNDAKAQKTGDDESACVPPLLLHLLLCAADRSGPARLAS